MFRGWCRFIFFLFSSVFAAEFSRIYEAVVGQGHKRWLWVRFPLGGTKYLIFLFNKANLRIRRKVGKRKCPNWIQDFPIPIPCTGYSVNLKKNALYPFPEYGNTSFPRVRIVPQSFALTVKR